MRRRNLILWLGATCVAGQKLLADTVNDPHAGHAGYDRGHSSEHNNDLHEHEHEHEHDATQFNVNPSERILRTYVMPDVPLTDQSGRQRRLAHELDSPGPIFLNFIFTTCPGICPMLSALFAQTADILGRDTPNLRYWSMSIDPAFDTPERLTAYSKLYNAQRHWDFFTGTRAAVHDVRRAFEADDDNKMAHRSLILLRTEVDEWLRFEGNHSATNLAAAARAAMAT